MFQIKATCSAGHEQTLHFETGFGREWVQTQAGLLDGTSPLYMFPPGEHSVIGKCGICGKPIACQVIETDDPSPPADGDISVRQVPGGVQMRQER